MDAPTAGSPVDDDPASHERPASARRPTAFVVDDNEMLLGLLSRILCADGFAVTQARSVEEALALDPAAHDVLLVDVRLRGESGTDIIDALRAVDPTVTDRCLLLTGAAALDPLPPDLPVVLKPFTADDLLAAIRSLRSGPGHHADPRADTGTANANASASAGSGTADAGSVTGDAGSGGDSHSDSGDGPDDRL